MSQDTLLAGPLSDDASQTHDRAVIDENEPGTRHPSRRPPLRVRPQSWHPYGPVEPPLESSSSRSIGVHAILNPPMQAGADLAGASRREPRSLPGPSASPRRRQGSSPASRPVHPSAQPLSPRSHSRPLMNPGSPSARFVGGGGRSSGQSSVSHSPLVPQEPLVGARQARVSSPLPLDSTLRSIPSLLGTQPTASASLHSTPSVHSRRTSTGPGPLTKPNSQETSPTTPHSSYSHFGHASPVVANVSLPPSTAPYPAGAAGAYVPMESINRTAPTPTAPRESLDEDTGSRAGTPGSTTMPGLIPCVLDLKSGSSSQAEKRKANSDASRRFRNRKRNEMQLEQRLSAQQDEIQRHMETVRRQTEELRSLAQQRDHYRAERDFYRDHLGRSMSLSQLPPRPQSPRAAQPILLPAAETPAASVWSGVDAARAAPSGSHATTPAGRLLETARPQGRWPDSPASYSPVPPHTGRSLASAGPPPVTGVPLPPFQGSWSRP
ncbi:uncharacterized protein N7459_005830 [Penicillium hispanicum]|uniref:uncharacterized protein n=1 Tax=Penicillium hispanicum TaxID=1080232 RepID=UPI002540A5ED|nr:uncharacterized protein N7459_005830 [Penicillium hispanicum]KAJ5579845.1 hypothetical protein N7459_005830 [Penicillium hispanicum]